MFFREFFVRYSKNSDITVSERDWTLASEFQQGICFRKPEAKSNQKAKQLVGHEQKMFNIRKTYLDFLSSVECASGFFHPDHPYQEGSIEGANQSSLRELLVNYIFEQFFCSLTEIRRGNTAILLFAGRDAKTAINNELKQKQLTRKRKEVRRIESKEKKTRTIR